MTTLFKDQISYETYGETIAAGKPLYKSTGVGNDSGRTAGRLYLLDVATADRNVLYGIAKEAGVAADVNKKVIIAGKAEGFSALTPGLPVYASLVTPGAVTQVKPTSNIQAIGIAQDADTVFVNGALGGSFLASEGGSGVGGVDILFAQDFESAALGDFTQTGLSLSSSSPLRGAVSALMTHQAGVPQSFKQIVAVAEKFRGRNLILDLDLKSTATAGNVTISIYDETNAASIIASEQLNLSSEVGGIKNAVSFTLPTTCASFSYTITALQEAGSPVTRVDDIICQIASSSLLETSVTVPKITAWAAYTPTFTGFGTATNIEFQWRQDGENVEIRGKFISGISTSVEARVSLPNSYTSAGASLIPSIQLAGDMIGTNFAGTLSRWNTLIEPTVSYMTFGVQSSTQAGFTKALGTTVDSSGSLKTFSLTASIPILGLSATEDVTIPLTQSGIVQEADTYIKLHTANGYGSTNTVIPRFSTLQTSIGDGIVYADSATLGNSFTAVTEGVYSFTGHAATSANVTNFNVGLSVNLTAPITTAVTSISNTNLLGVARDNVNTAATQAKLITFAWTGRLVAGDIVRVHTDGNVLADVMVNATRQGSLSQVTVNTNSKITIPTSELRFEGASAKGTGAEAATVQYLTIAKVRGDAFTISSSNGTLVTMTKAGKLNIAATLLTTAAATFSITKNQTAPATYAPTVSEIMAGATTVTPTFHSAAAWEGNVDIGDVFRVSTGGTPNSGTNCNLNFSFQEQDIQVSVSNTLPQFSESDSSVRLDTSNGFGSTNTQVRRFSNVRQNIGTDIVYADSASEGASFTAMESGIYSASFSEVSSVNIVNMDVILTVNAVNAASVANVLAVDNQIYNTANANGKYASVSWTGYLTAGDVVRAVVSTASSNNGAGSYFTMSKVGKPNVTGVDVTPFVNVPQPTVQSMYLTGTAVVTDTVIKPTVISDTNNGIVSYVVATGVFTLQKKARLNLSFTAATNGASSVQPAIYINGAAIHYGNSPAVINNGATVSLDGEFPAGTTFQFQVGNTTNAYRVSVLATANPDQILTVPDTFSTDTSPLVYANAATYTLATLANAPVGTYLTYTYGASGNVRTQTTGVNRPTQTDADMNTNGMLLYTRAYNAASTAALPVSFAIQIGKGLKGKSLDLYKSAGKVNAGSVDRTVPSTTNENGIGFKEYNEATGILIIDAGIKASTANTSHVFIFGDDLSGQSSGYLVINASKNPALTGLGLPLVYSESAGNAGNVLTANVTPIPWINISDTHGAWNGTTYNVPDSGIYSFNGSVFSNSIGFNVQMYRNGVAGKFVSGNYAATTHLVACSIRLNKGDQITFRLTAGATLVNTAEVHHLTITKTNVG